MGITIVDQKDMDLSLTITVKQIAEICQEALKIHHDCIGDKKIDSWQDDAHKDFKIMVVASQFKSPMEMNSSPESQYYFVSNLISVFNDVLTRK